MTDEKKPTEPTEVMYKVYDLNATQEDPKTDGYKPRTHEIVTETDGEGNVLRTKSYTLRSDEGKEMTMAHAMKFLNDEAFRVEDDKGNIVKPVRKKRDDHTELEVDEVVATFDELTKEALFKRCQAQPGSENIKKSTAKGDLAEFLIKASERKKAAVGLSRGSEGKIGEMADMDNMLDLSGQLPKKDSVLDSVNI